MKAAIRPGGLVRRASLHIALAASLLPSLLSGDAHAKPDRAVPSTSRLTLLLRATIVALDHANDTGNYTVFRDLGSPEFRRANSAADLARIFSALRSRKLDLRPVVLFTPKFTRKPRLTRRNTLRLTGYFPTKPLRVYFDLVYRRIAKRWRLFAIAVDARPPVN